MSLSARNITDPATDSLMDYINEKSHLLQKGLTPLFDQPETQGSS